MKKDIESQVAALSDTKRDLILKIGKVYIWLLAVVAIPILAYAILNLVKVLDVSKNEIIADELLKNNIVALCILLIYIIASLIFVKVKFPFYSDKKYKYLKKTKWSYNDPD